MRPPDIARPDARSQAIARVVRLPDNLLLRLERDHREPGARDTGLTTGGEDARNDAVDHPFVRVVEHDVGRLAAQFEAHTGQVIGGVLHDPDPCRRRAGEGHLVYPWMAHERPAAAG